LLDLVTEIAALVRGRAVDAQPDGRARVEEGAYARDARAEPEVRGRAVRDPDAFARERGHVRIGQVHAVRAPDVRGRPAEVGEVLDRRAPVELAAVILFLGSLGQVRVQTQAE